VIELKEGRYYVGVWWVAWTGGDWMACVWRDDKEEHLQYRFRYYADDKAFDSDDTKNWYSMARDIQPDAETIEQVNTVARAIGAELEAVDVEYIYIGGDNMKAWRALQNAPWAHWRRADDEGANG